MLDRGDGSVEDIDKSLELGAGHPMGPLTLAVRWACRDCNWKPPCVMLPLLRAHCAALPKCSHPAPPMYFLFHRLALALIVGSGLIASPCSSAFPRIAGLRGTGYLPLHSGWLGAQVPERTIVRRTGVPEAKSSSWETRSENGRGILSVGWGQTGDCCTLNIGLLANVSMAPMGILANHSCWSIVRCFAHSCCLIVVGIVHDGTRPLLAGVTRHVYRRDGSGGWGSPSQAVGVRLRE